MSSKPGPSKRSAKQKRGPSYNHRTTTYSPPDAIVIDSNSEPEVISLLDDESDSDIQVLEAKPQEIRRVTPEHSKPSSSRQTSRTVIDLSDEDTSPLHTTLLPSASTVDKHENDEDSAPEGFEIWEPTVPLKVPPSSFVPKFEEVDERDEELAWTPPRMAWFGSERTGASGPRAFLELAPPRRKPPHFPPKDVTYLSEASRSDNLWARTRSRYGPPRELMVYTETSILNSSPIVPMPGMHAPRGAVNCIAQAKGFIAVGRSYEESSTYDGGGLTLWRAKTQRAQHLFAHIARRSQRNDGRSNDGPLKQYSILSLAFDPANNSTLLSGGDDNQIQLWRVSEEDDVVESVGRLHVRRPGYIQYHPEGDLAAIGCSNGLQVFSTESALQSKYTWHWKRQGEETVNASWGVNRSKNTIVAGTQHNELVYGRLVYIDVQVGKAINRIDTEACASLTVDPTGTITAFGGSGRAGNPNRHILRLYDVQRTGWRATAQIGIPASKAKTHGEIIDAAWSPDGIHLAFGRDDNSVNVFDVRWLGQEGCMVVFRHDNDTNNGDGAESYGVQGMAWFGSEKLVSGGADHCVRLWDVRRDDPCKVLATLSGAVGNLMGTEDPHMFPIVAGDQLGNTYYLPARHLIPDP